MTDSTPVRVLFIGGMPRSGSTLFDLMVGQLPNHCDVGELFYMWQAGPLRDQLCACGERFSDCPFWRKVGDEAFGGWDRVDPERILAMQRRLDTTSAVLLRRFHLRRPDAVELAEYLRTWARLYAAISTVSGAAIVVDSTKRPSSATLLRDAPGVDLRIAHVVRDPRGVVNSWNKQVALPAGAGPRDYLKRRSPRQILRRWLTVNLMIERLGRSGVPLTRIRYEDMVSDPRRALRQVLELMDEPVTDEALSFVDEDGTITTGASHAAEGGRVRLQTGRLPLRLDESWRTALSPRLQRTIRLVAGPLMRHYGYR